MRRSRNDDSLDEEFSFWSGGSYLSCKEGEFEKARLSIIAIDEEILYCGVGRGIDKEWGCFSIFVGGASTTELRRGSVTLVDSDRTTVCAPRDPTICGFLSSFKHFLLGWCLALCPFPCSVSLVGDLFQY